MKAIAIIGAILGLTSILMGAASDHLFSGFITAETANRLDVALRYHQLYSVLILFLGLHGLTLQPNPALKWSGYLFCLGTFIFCISLYLSLLPTFGGAVFLTPLGGTCLILAWALLILGLIRLKMHQDQQ